MNITLFFDGASRGNPGVAGAGAYLVYSNNKAVELSSPVGKQTNNYAEYCGMLIGLQYINKHRDGVKSVKVVGDSKLVVEQMSGNWQMKSDNLRDLYNEANRIVSSLKSAGIEVSFQYTPRKNNKKADELANQGADKV